jgi:Mg2+ and Co2+ transporter CorA
MGLLKEYYTEYLDSDQFDYLSDEEFYLWVENKQKKQKEMEANFQPVIDLIENDIKIIEDVLKQMRPESNDLKESMEYSHKLEQVRELKRVVKKLKDALK